MRVGGCEGLASRGEALRMKRKFLPSCKTQTAAGLTPAAVTGLDSVVGLNGGAGQAGLRSGVKGASSHTLRFNYGGEASASSRPASAPVRPSTYSRRLPAVQLTNQAGVSCSGGRGSFC